MTNTSKKPLKVYGWTGSRNESRGPRNHHGQTREIVAASSAAEVMRLTGMTRSTWNYVGCETGNAEELETARARPGVIFWIPINERGENWTAVEPTPRPATHSLEDVAAEFGVDLDELRKDAT